MVFFASGLGKVVTPHFNGRDAAAFHVLDIVDVLVTYFLPVCTALMSSAGLIAT